MSRRSASLVAWSLWLGFVLVTAAGIVLLAINGAGRISTATNVSLSLAMAAFATVGAVVASRRPENAIGWLFCAIALGVSTASLCQEYARYALITQPGSFSGGSIAAWAGNWLFGLSIALNVFVLLLFPTGQPPSPGWKWVLWMAVAALGSLFVSTAFMPGGLGFEFSEISARNPFGFEAAEGLLKTLSLIGNVLLMGVLISSIASLILRARRAGGEERQQLKWFAYGAALMLVINFGVNPLAAELAPSLTDLPFTFGLALLPVLMGVAILKYRLFDIDVIINRTLVYGGLTASLSVAYLVLVVLLQQVLAPVARESDLAVAGSTLAVAALFRPARARVQSLIDHRFYRRKYDAAKTIERFGATLRDEIDIDSLSRALVGVVGQTLQPTHASLWLRPSSRDQVSVETR